jgi:hypothetical protein
MSGFVWNIFQEAGRSYSVLRRHGRVAPAAFCRDYLVGALGHEFGVKIMPGICLRLRNSSLRLCDSLRSRPLNERRIRSKTMAMIGVRKEGGCIYLSCRRVGVR